MRGDELPLVSSPPPRLSSSASSSLSSTHLSALEDSSTSTSISRKDPPRTVSLTALSFAATSQGPGEASPGTHRDSAAAGTPAAPTSRVSIPSEPQTPRRGNSSTPRPASTTAVQLSASPARPASVRPVSVAVGSPQHHSVSAPQSAVSSPRRISVGPQRPAVSSDKISVSPSRVAASPQRTRVSTHEPVSYQSAPVSPAKISVNQGKGNCLPQEATERGGGGGQRRGHTQRSNQITRSPEVTTTIPVGQGSSSSNPAAVPQHAAHLNVSPATKNGVLRGPGVAGEGKRATHEKNKSVTIVVNDQQVAYTSSNGVANGGVHPEAAGQGDATRPSSAASLQPGTKVDPDMQVRPLVGWWGGESGSAGSVLEDAASSDDCHRSTLTLVHSPARTYLSGEAGDAVVGEDSGEAWSGGVTSLCGVALLLGAAVWLRLPGLLYEFGAGSFLAAWCGAVVVVAAPLALLEASLAQFSSSAAIALWRLIPIARGVGWSTVVVCLYWAAVVLGLVAPLLHYLLLALNPALLVVSGSLPLYITINPLRPST
ncbi:Sodium-dependent dopamine transporter [Chionoecetes opilio]|uniref:Sodium-dependent nutrient amino acid transporter 1 n=1 Tax=Chionoecetes opilio TaxID=41210 RepID=A0A8J4YMH3_CHIOP|nr:Sodium-dependent dopamine transporter [Chionoecetes opilio]